MDVKLLELRDRGTFVPAMATRLGPTGGTAGDCFAGRATTSAGRS
jgi:hypothetical protein